MEIVKVLKAMADETRYKILTLLLQQNYCVRALSREIGLSESAISQHIKILKEAGLLDGMKKGYFMHYYVDKDILNKLALNIEKLTTIEQGNCNPEENIQFKLSDRKRCHTQRQGRNCFNKGK